VGSLVAVAVAVMETRALAVAVVAARLVTRQLRVQQTLLVVVEHQTLKMVTATRAVQGL
jgi:hypothetical protein